jgi:hypothetical protein
MWLALLPVCKGLLTIARMPTQPIPLFSGWAPKQRFKNFNNRVSIIMGPMPAIYKLVIMFYHIYRCAQTCGIGDAWWTELLSNI